jgi:hypothetical protein
VPPDFPVIDPVNMTRHNLHISLGGRQPNLQRRYVLKPDRILKGDAGAERRVMERDDHRTRSGIRQRFGEMYQAFRSKLGRALTLHESTQPCDEGIAHLR